MMDRQRYKDIDSDGVKKEIERRIEREWTWTKIDKERRKEIKRRG